MLYIFDIVPICFVIHLLSKYTALMGGDGDFSSYASSLCVLRFEIECKADAIYEFICSSDVCEIASYERLVRGD